MIAGPVIEDAEDTQVTTCVICPVDKGPFCVDKAHASASQARLRAVEGLWSTLELTNDGEAYRHVLDGRVVSEFTQLLLQHTRHDEDALGKFVVHLQEGSLVTYVIAWDRRRRCPLLLGKIGNHPFRTELEPWMRFRWLPEGSS